MINSAQRYKKTRDAVHLSHHHISIVDGHLYRSSDTARIPSKYHPLKDGASFIAPSRRYLSVQGVQSSSGRWYEPLLLRGQSTIGLRYEPVVVCTRSTITSKPSHYESSPYSINKERRTLRQEGHPSMRSYTLREVQSTRASPPPSRHIYPRDNGDTREKASPSPAV